MIMSREKREIQKNDIIPLDIYMKQRKELRKNIVEFKKNRRISLGPYATFYFESYETMLAQVQEMLYIEKGGDDQLKDELTAYNPLIPNGKELIATLMFEIDNPVSRATFLGKVGGIEQNVFMKIRWVEDVVVVTDMLRCYIFGSEILFLYIIEMVRESMDTNFINFQEIIFDNELKL